MEHRFTFFLTLGTTLAIAVYGTSGALYSEIQKPNYERNSVMVAVVFFLALASLTSTISCFAEAYRIVKKEGR